MLPETGDRRASIHSTMQGIVKLCRGSRLLTCPLPPLPVSPHFTLVLAFGLHEYQRPCSLLLCHTSGPLHVLCLSAWWDPRCHSKSWLGVVSSLRSSLMPSPSSVLRDSSLPLTDFCTLFVFLSARVALSHWARLHVHCTIRLRAP